MLVVPAYRVTVHRVLQRLELGFQLVDPPFEPLDAAVLERPPPTQAS